MSDLRPNEEFGRISYSETGWQSYSHLDGDELIAFKKLMKSPKKAFLLAMLFGFFGAHRFYLGHYRFGAGIIIVSLFALFTNSTALVLIASAIVLIEIGHIVRTVEQLNDSLEGALMLQTHTKPLFKD